jgi:hypothetical protein
MPRYYLSVDSSSRWASKSSTLKAMTKAVHRTMEKFTSDSYPPSLSSIHLQTENGFSIVRRRGVDGSNSSAGTAHCFIVQDTDGDELEITVDITDRAVAEIARRSRGCLSLRSSYWIAFEERHLATYLWEHGDYPPDGRLTINDLTLDDLDLARRWKDLYGEL